MKNCFIILFCLITVMILFACNNTKRKPGKVYMPDMAYSRAYETYADHSNLTNDSIYYNSLPVAGTIARGEDISFLVTKDKTGDTVNYFASRKIKSPVDSLNKNELVETERLYLIYCGICHGTKLDGNGPLYKNGNGTFPAKPATLAGDAKYTSMPEGQMFYSVTYGKNLMGSYASQLTQKQRWQIIRYIKMKQAENKTRTSK